MRLLLASASPRRAELLRAAGFEFDIRPADVDESVHPGETPHAYTSRVAGEKATAVLPAAANRVVIAADTVVVVDGLILGKPASPSDAARMLGLLSGRRHEVVTAVAVAAPGQALRLGVETTAVDFARLSDDDIAWYVASGEPSDKAGGYAIQGLAARFVTRVEGSYSNVVGLPIARVHAMLQELALEACH